MTQSAALPRIAGKAQGITLVTVAFLPIVAIVSMFPAVPAIIEHFAARDPSAIAKVPAMVSAPGLAIAVLSLFAGFFVDKFGRRRLLLGSTFIYGFAGAAPFFLDNLDSITLSRYLLGVAEAAILTTLNTLIGDYWDEKGRRFWLTVQGICGPFLGSAVILLSGYLTHFQWNAIFLVYLVGLPAFLACALFLFEPEQDNTARQMLGMDEDASAFPWKGVATYGLITLFGGALYYVFIINGGIVWSEIGVKDPAEIGKMTTIPSLFVMAGAGVFWLTGKMGPRWQLFALFALLGTGLAMMGLIHDWRGMVVAMAIQQTGAGMAVPCLIAWAQSHLPFAHRGRGMGIWTACFFMGQFTSPLLVSAMRVAAGSMQGAFLYAGIAGLVCAVAALIIVSGRGANAAA
ncbi:MFS transporter [Novosphingobium sp. FSY-8]|uniref:MFS transporter n=1 Tax=Novosphingobium ovatum TaxID=1908523 RepID=A0ABW9XBM9_9SPHN|nr:MFS transporter [Novosphingobium ovatum]NBC35948.1 MFS transporter [Novosphingobium ovatum]